MATTFTDRTGYVHTTHTVVRPEVIVHQVWTADATGFFIGVRRLLTHPFGREGVPEGWWVLVSDFSPVGARLLPPSSARRLLAAWNVAGAGFLWHEPAATKVLESA